MSTCFNAGSGVLRANGNTVFGSTDGALEFPPNIEMPKTGDSHMIFSDFRIFYQTVYPNDPNSPLTKDIDQIEKLNLKYMTKYIFHPSILYQLRLSVGHTIYLAVGRILRRLDYSK